MADITVFAKNGTELGSWSNADFDATDIGTDTPEPNFTSFKTQHGDVVEIWGDVIVMVYKQKGEE